MVHLRPLSRRWWPLLTLLVWPAQATPPVDADHQRDDLPVRTALYAYYDSDPLTALTEIAAAAVRGTTANNADARLLEAGIRLGYGLDRSARTLLGELAASGQLKPERLTTARLFLARSYLRQGLPQLAAPLLDDSQAHGEQQAVELLYWRQQLALTLGQPLPALPDELPRSELLPYIHFNQAVALANSGEREPALAHIEAARQALRHRPATRGRNWAFWRGWFAPKPLPLASDERDALIDQLALAEGQLALTARDGAAAMQALLEVRQQGPASSEALLRYGLAATLAGDGQLAVSVWQQLAQRPDLTPVTLQVFLAMGWALEQHGLIDDALRGYEQAEQRYLLALAELDQARQQFSAEQLLASLNGPDQQQLSPLLRPWLARNSSQALVGQLRDLDELGQTLAQREQSLEALEQMVAARAERHRSRVARLEQLAPEPRIADFEQQLATIRQQLASAEADPAQLATADENQWLQRIARSHGVVTRLAGDKRQPRYGERLRRVQGVLAWQLADQQPIRLQQQRLALKGLEQQLAELKVQQQRVAALAAVPPGSAEFNARIASARSALAAAASRQRQLSASARQALVAAVRNELDSQQQQVRALLAHARLAQARLAEQRLDAEALP
ncbi:MAG: hypothetical protein II007_06110 [Gammaproteobacteria bacterium]|nr:hypothetical protein [Gammaproteobacteria bacterium]